MPLSYTELCELVEQGVITGVAPERINAASIDLTLNNMLMIEDCCTDQDEVDLSAKPRQFPTFLNYYMDADGFLLLPGTFLLASTNEKFYLPDNICADYRLNSSLARAGLNAALAMWADPGWNGAELTLELKNWTEYHHLRIKPGMKIGQMIFHRVTPVPADRSYAKIGSYNGTVNGPSIRA